MFEADLPAVHALDAQIESPKQPHSDEGLAGLDHLDRMDCASESERRLVLSHEVSLSAGQRDLLATESLELKQFNHAGRQRNISIESRIQQGVNLTVRTIPVTNEKGDDNLSVPGYATNRCHDELPSLDQRLAPR
jgi:hypothetical protein